MRDALASFMLTSRRSRPRLTRLLLVGQSQHVTRLTLKPLAELLQSIEVDPESFTLLQSPQRRVADARFFG